MTWTKLLGSHDVQRHRTSQKELDDMRALVARDLADFPDQSDRTKQAVELIAIGFTSARIEHLTATQTYRLTPSVAPTYGM